MAIAEDTTNSPARVVSSGATTTTAAFTPPNTGCILVCFMHGDANTGAADETLTASDSLSGTWSTPILDNARGGAATAISWRAVAAGTAASMTTSVTDNKGSVAKSNFTRIFTGTDLTAPFGATGVAGTSNISLVSTVTNSWCWSALLTSNVLQVAGANTTQKTEFGGFDGGDSIGVYASTNTTATAGTTITLAETGGTPVHNVAVELLPPSGGGATLNGAWAPAAGATLTTAGSATSVAAATLTAGAQLAVAAGVTKLGAVTMGAGAQLTTAATRVQPGVVTMGAGAILAAAGTAVAVAAWAPAAGAAFSLAGARAAVSSIAFSSSSSFTLAASGTQAAAWAPSAGASLVAAGSSGLTLLVRAVLVPGGSLGAVLVPGGAAGSSLISDGVVGSTLSAGGV